MVCGSFGRPVAHHAPSTTPATESSAFSHRTSARIDATVLPNCILVQCLVLPHDVVAREPGPRVCRGVAAHDLPAITVSQNLDGRAGHRIHIARLAERPRDAFLHDFDEATRFAANNRCAGRE